MTVTIKKNTDVQAEFKADKIKYQVKRDLSGDVQWTNCSTVGNLATTTIKNIIVQTASTTATAQASTGEGWNFFRVPKIRVKASITSGFTWGAPNQLKAYGKFYVNGSLKAAATTSTSVTGLLTAAATTTFTPTGTTKSLSIASSSPNSITVKVKGKWIATQGALVGNVTARMLSNAQRNDKTTVMATT